MSVGRRLLWSQITLVVCAGLVGGATLIGLLSVRHRYLAAEEQYEELRSLYEIGHRAATIRLLLRDKAPDSESIRNHLALAIQQAESLDGPSSAPADDGTLALQSAGASIHDCLRQVVQHLNRGGVGSPEFLAGVNRSLGQVANLAGAAEREIIANRQAATTRFQNVLVAMAVLLGATIAMAIAVGAMQYRSVMKPLRALHGAMEQLAGARFGRRLAEQGDREFRHLMRRFNQMSDALENLHATMVQQVELKSRALVRSEQLASVGCLAAGLAHEINNPLGIIAGYAERSLRHLRAAREPSDHADTGARVEQTLETICEEAFRCRDITRDLLQLAQPTDAQTKDTLVLPLVERAMALVRVLPIARDRQLVFCPEGSPGEFICHGHPSQLLQVFINLLTNSLEACVPGDGRVIVSLEKGIDSIVVTVRDNGCGMTSETVAQAFDPFFTDKPRRELIGCGLGLSVSHAIIERHQGRLYAQSDGPNRGSTLTVELPAVSAPHSERACLVTAQ